MTDLGTLVGGTSSVAFGINNRGDVVGESDTTGDTASQHAFLFSHGRMTDLDKLIPAGSGITLFAANGINDNGQIAASGRTSDGEVHAFLLTPGGGDPASMILYA